MTSLRKSFERCSFAPATVDASGNPTSVKPSRIGTWQMTSFFLDSSGRSTFNLPLDLTFSSREELEVFSEAKCLHAPSLSRQQTTDNDNSQSSEESSVGFEIKSHPFDEFNPVVVEDISVRSCTMEDLTVHFETEITVRALSHESGSVGSIELEGGEQDKLNIATSLEITPVLTTKKLASHKEKTDLPDLMALELGAIPDHMQKESSARIQESRLNCLTLNVTLTHALTIEVKSVQGPTLGNTLISLTIRHSNSHLEPVTITNIALHPGHSRYETASKSNRTMAGGQHSITNMTKVVQWGYAPRTELSLPLCLKPKDAYSTCLVVNAGEELHSRFFISPVSVTGIVGNYAEGGETCSNCQRVVVASDVHWATELVAIEPAEAFRIEMSFNRTEIRVGEPISVKLRIFNLSIEPRDLMLLMAKDDHKSGTPRDDIVNTAVVSEVEGYTFGVWGVSGEDDGTARLNRDHGMLAIDSALLLGEVLGQHAVDAELRFVPLCAGRLNVPNWKLYDKSSGEWFGCLHNLSLVATN